MIFLPLLFAISSWAAPLSLRDAAIYALQHSPAFDSAQRETLIAELTRKNAGSAFLPSLDLSAAHGWRGSSPRTDSGPWSSSVSLALTENLYDNGQSITNYRSSKLAEEISRLQLQQNRDRLLLEIASAYYQYSIAVKGLEIQEEQHQILKKQYQLVEAGYRQGIKTRKDYLRFKTQVNRADIDLVNARDGVLQSAQGLKRLMGIPLASGETPAFTIEESKPPKSRPEKIRLESHRDFRIAELQNENVRLQERQVKRRLWPELSLTGGANWGSSEYLGTGRSISENDSLSWNAVLSLRYNFLDWGTRSREARIAGERTEIQLNSSTAALQALRQELESLELNIRQLTENFRLGEELLSLEQTNLDLITQEYRQGKVQYLDYITSVRDFASARSGYYNSLFNLKKGLLTQKFHQGAIYEAIVGN